MINIDLVLKFQNWLTDEGKGAKTLTTYIHALTEMANWYTKVEGLAFSPTEVTTLHLRQFISHLDEELKQSPATINKKIAALKTFFKFAGETGIISHNPMVKIKMKRTQEQYAAPKWLSKIELAKFLHEIEKEKMAFKRIRNLTICKLMAEAGLRVEEVADLVWGDINIKKGREMVTVRNGKGNKYRVIPLNKDVMNVLTEWKDFVGMNYVGINEESPCFVSGRTTQVSTRSIGYMVKYYAKKAGLKDDVSPHSLRHTFCKNLVDQGVGLEQVAYLAGHESLETTRRYTKPSENDLRKAVNTISEERD
jgi:integrase/recombinase XerC